MRSPFDDPLFATSYELVAPLGRGGMGEVVRVRHRVWEIDLAAKIPLPSAVASAGGLERFRAEAATWIGLSAHPNVVTCHYVRVLSGVPVLFSEYVPGGSLADAIARGSFEGGARTAEAEVRALGVARDLAWGLAHAHATGVVHQDVKPSNVLLADEGAKRTDFGIANFRGANDARRDAVPGIQTATVLGMTPLYASPEQIAALSPDATGAGRITGATDVWSLALTLLETLVGAARWQPADLASIARELEGLTPELSALLAPLLAAAPAQRPTAIDVARSLDRVLAARGAPRRPPNVAALLATGLNNRAVSALDLGSNASAVRLLDEALASDPCHPEAVYNRALLAWRAGECSDIGALDRIKQGLATASGWEPHLLEAWVHVERGDEEAAWRVLDRVAEQGAGAPRATRAVARASRSVKDAVREVASFRAHRGTADALAISPDESLVATGGRDGTVRVFELGTGRKVQEFAHADDAGDENSKFVMGVAFSPDGTRVYSAGWNGAFRGFAVPCRVAGEPLFRCEHAGYIGGVALSPDGAAAWTWTSNGTLRAWSLGPGGAEPVRDLLSLPGDLAVMCVALDPRGRHLVAGGEDDVLRVLDAATGDLVRETELGTRPYALAFTRDAGRDVLLVGTGNQRVILLDASTLEPLDALTGMQTWVDASR